MVQETIANKEGELLSIDSEERTYILQTFMDGRECSLKEEKECMQAIQTMAKMHTGMILEIVEDQDIPLYSLKKE